MSREMSNEQEIFCILHSPGIVPFFSQSSREFKVDGKGLLCSCHFLSLFLSLLPYTLFRSFDTRLSKIVSFCFFDCSLLNMETMLPYFVKDIKSPKGLPLPHTTEKHGSLKLYKPVKCILINKTCFRPGIDLISGEAY